MPLNLNSRARTAELMDAPDVDPAALDHAMGHLEVINRLLNGYGPSIAGIERLLRPLPTQFSLLDIGCGSGDTLRHIAQWARRRGIQARLTGIELSEISADRARRACAAFPEISIKSGDFMQDGSGKPGGGNGAYDLTHCALVLHHFSDDAELVKLLRRMGACARAGIIVNDLHRHPLAYHSIRLLTRACSRSEILRNDAPLSVARGFTRRELLNYADLAGLEQVEIDWHWAFRWLLTAQGKPHHDR